MVQFQILELSIAVWITFKMTYSSSSSSTVVSSSVVVDKVIIIPFSPQGEVLDLRPVPGADKNLVFDARLPDGLAVGNAFIEQKRAKRQAKNENEAAKQAESLPAGYRETDDVGKISSEYVCDDLPDVGPYDSDDPRSDPDGYLSRF